MRQTDAATVPATDPGQAAHESNSLLIPTVTLLVLLAAVDLWCTRHLGMGLTDPRWLGAVGVSFGAAAAILDFIAPKRDKDAIPNKVRGVLRVLLSPKAQIVALVVVVAFGATLSSVVVLPEPEAQPAALQLTALEDGQTHTAVLQPGENPDPFLVQTTPFGRLFELKLDGYLPLRFEVFPLVGATVSPGDDLEPSPTLLIRPHWKALRALEDNATLVVKLGNGTELVRDKGSRSSFLVGRNQSLPSTSLGTWGLELNAEAGVAENVRARTLLEWSRPKHLVPAQELAPGMEIDVMVVSAADKVVARASARLGRQRLIDVPVLLVQSGGSP